jgi:hypothetical protein
MDRVGTGEDVDPDGPRISLEHGREQDRVGRRQRRTEKQTGVIAQHQSGVSLIDQPRVPRELHARQIMGMRLSQQPASPEVETAYW